MPLSMKIQPIDEKPGSTEPIKPAPMIVKSRLKRLFRISVSEPAPTVVPAQAGEIIFEPSSICLAKMVQNFIEESTEKPSAVKCGRNRCNCFNGNGSSDVSDTESDNNNNNNITSADVCDFLKSLVVCASVEEKNVLADTARIVSEKKTCKRKDELRKVVVDGLIGLGYDAAICKSKWDKSSSFPAGEYEYVDVIIGGERLIIDIDLRSEFEVARSTKTYKSILQTLPHIFVGKSERLSKIICIISEAAKQSLKKKGMHIPPWRKTDYVQAKWLSPPTRIISSSTMVTPPPSPLSPAPASSVIASDGFTPEKVITGHTDLSQSKLSSSSPSSESIFDMSESSGEEEVKEKECNPNPMKKGSEFVVEVITTGLASIMEENL